MRRKKLEDDWHIRTFFFILMGIRVNDSLKMLNTIGPLQGKELSISRGWRTVRSGEHFVMSLPLERLPICLSRRTVHSVPPREVMDFPYNCTRILLDVNYVRIKLYFMPTWGINIDFLSNAGHVEIWKASANIKFGVYSEFSRPEMQFDSQFRKRRNRKG